MEETEKNIHIMKSLENILQERAYAYNSFFDKIVKSRVYFEAFQVYDGSLRQALDALLVYVEQEMQQSRLQSVLYEIRKKIYERRTEMQQRVSEYQREILSSERDLQMAEKKLQRSKDTLEKYIQSKKRFLLSI